MRLTFNGARPIHLDSVEPNQLQVPAVEALKPTTIAYYVASHDRPVDYSSSWDQELQRADLVFHEHFRWLPEYQVALQRISQGEEAALTTIKPSSYSYRKYEGVLGSEVKQDFWDVSAMTHDNNDLADLDMVDAGYLKAEDLLVAGQDEAAVEVMTDAMLMLAHSDTIRDNFGIKRVLKRTGSYETKHDPKNTDSGFLALVFAGAAHVYQAVALSKVSQEINTKVEVWSQLSELAIHIGTAQYRDYLEYGEMTPDSVVKSWLLNVWRIRDRMQNPSSNWAEVSNPLAEIVAETDYESAIRHIHEALIKLKR